LIERKPISKKIRFEVFKRDSFKCQYCGKSAPEVILHIDHVIPVSEGGKNNLTNLVTSCMDCNLGKGARSLSDNSIVEKQKAQLDELNARREQLKMVVKWRDELNKLEDEQVDHIEKRIRELSGASLSDYGRSQIKKMNRKFDFTLILDSIEKSGLQYLKRDGKGNFTGASIEKFIDYIPKICSSVLLEEKFPEIKDINYIKGILRNRIGSDAAENGVFLVRHAYNEGVPLEIIRSIARSVDSLAEFRDAIDNEMY